MSTKLNWQHHNVPFVCKGLDLIHPLDDVPDYYFPKLTNTDCLNEGEISHRRGVIFARTVGTAPRFVDSILPLVDNVALGAGAYVYITNVTSGTTKTASGGEFAGGYTNKSMIKMQPRFSNREWAYVCDGTSLGKVRDDGAWRSWGLNPSHFLNTYYYEYSVHPPRIVTVTSTTIYNPAGTYATTTEFVGDGTVACGSVASVTVNARKPTQRKIGATALRL